MRPVGAVPSSPRSPGLGLPHSAPARAVVVHVTTVPISLRAHLSGQGRFMRSRGFEVHAITSPGPEADEFSRRGDAAPMYPAMDVVALPIFREGFPNVALAAAAMALPIGATDVPGCRAAVAPRNTGTLIPARDILALERALERCLDDPALRTCHGAAAGKRVIATFGREAIGEAIALEYGTLLAARGALPLDGGGLRAVPAAPPSHDRELK
jgi:glycosyltransferase involved in cell wall biosynthesis